jgi:hypothetical protein
MDVLLGISAFLFMTSIVAFAIAFVMKFKLKK